VSVALDTSHAAARRDEPLCCTFAKDSADGQVESLVGRSSAARLGGDEEGTSRPSRRTKTDAVKAMKKQAEDDQGLDPLKSNRGSKAKGKAKAQRRRLDADDPEDDYRPSEEGSDEESLESSRSSSSAAPSSSASNGKQRTGDGCK
jgi:hypothetical protein